MAPWASERSCQCSRPPEEFPYTIRVVSEVLSSNGSTSQASICGSTLALMDAGVPIKAPVAGIAMGLVMDESTGAYKVLTDIQGMEDHLGDMDFKVAGTRDGITALQMDIKVQGISRQIMAEALEQARQARYQILDVITECIPEPNEMSLYAPRMTTMQIHPDKIGAVIGSGGKTIRSIQEETDVKIDIEDDGTVFIAAANGQAALEAQRRIAGPGRRSRDRQDLYRARCAHHGLWRLCRVPARAGRPGAHLAVGHPARAHRRGCGARGR